MTSDEQFIRSILLQTSGKDQMTIRFRTWMQTLEDIVGAPANQPRSYSWSEKKRLFDIDPTCKICGQQILMIDDAEVDHITPFSKGGKTDSGNAQITHRYCNRNKSDK